MHRVHTEGERGRCSGIEFSTEDEVVSTESRSYDDAARLSLIEVTSSLPFLCANSTTHLGYDEEGRMRVRTMTCDDGAVSETRHVYLADGSERVEIDNGLTDVAGEGRIVITRPAPCLDIDRQIGTPPDARCRAQ